VYRSTSGKESSSSSVSLLSVELQAENALFIGGRTAGISIDVGASTSRLLVSVDRCDDSRTGKEKSGHERGDRGAVGSSFGW
jgi:hypothetical protein